MCVVCLFNGVCVSPLQIRTPLLTVRVAVRLCLVCLGPREIPQAAANSRLFVALFAFEVQSEVLRDSIACRRETILQGYSCEVMYGH